MIIKKGIVFVFLSLLICSSSCNHNNTNHLGNNRLSPPYLINYSVLLNTKNSFRNREEPIYSFGRNLLFEADKWLDSNFITIINKKHIPPSGDKHDYYSLGPYWWPDSTKENGKPYIRKDGIRNPERLEYDRPHLGKMANAVRSLTIAYVLTGLDKYKNKASGFLRTWFINEETRMNPHLEYGQAIPGITDGRGIGIIETLSFVDIVDAIGILFREDTVKSEEYLKLKQWFKDYNHWLNFSPKGLDEKNWYNNHGTSYDLQVISFSLFTGDTLKALSVLDSFATSRIIPQIEPDGSQPYELERTKSLSYSIFNTELFIKVAVIAERLNINLWSFESKDKRSIAQAILFIAPFLLEGNEWKYAELSDINSLKDRFFKIINVTNHKHKKLSFNKYFKDFETSKLDLQREVLLRPQNIIYIRK